MLWDARAGCACGISRTFIIWMDFLCLMLRDSVSCLMSFSTHPQASQFFVLVWVSATSLSHISLCPALLCLRLPYSFCSVPLFTLTAAYILCFNFIPLHFSSFPLFLCSIHHPLSSSWSHVISPQYWASFLHHTDIHAVLSWGLFLSPVVDI